MNPGFLLELVEALSKLLAVFILLLGFDHMDEDYMVHNFLVMIFIVCGVLMILMALLNYGKLSIITK